METARQGFLVSLAASALLLCSSAAVLARSPMRLIDGQLDRVTAGNTACFDRVPCSSAPPSALAISVTVIDLGKSTPPSSATSVILGGGADGKPVTGAAVNQTGHGISGVTFNPGWTPAYSGEAGLILP